MRIVKWLLGAAIVLTPFAAVSQTGAVQGHCYLGGKHAITSGLNSTNYLDGNIPACTVSVFLTGTTTKATIFADKIGTPLGNPFTANIATVVDPGGWIFWAATNAGLDVVLSGGQGNPSCTTQPNCYAQPVTLVDVFPSQSFTPVVNPLSIETNSVGNADQTLLNFTDTATVKFTNPSGGVESATVPDATNVVKGAARCDGTTTNCVAGVISANPTLNVQTNSVNNSSQTLLNFQNSPTVTFRNPSGGIETADVNVLGNIQMAADPPAAGTWLRIYPDTVTVTPGTGYYNATGTKTSATVYSEGCGLGGCTSPFQVKVAWTFVLPSYINPSNITDIYATTNYSSAAIGYHAGQESDSNVYCHQSTNDYLLVFSQSYSPVYNLQQFNVHLPGVTGAQVPTITCDVTLGSANVIQAGLEVKVASIFLQVQDTIDTAPPPALEIESPLILGNDSQGNTTLGLYFPPDVFTDAGGVANVYAVSNPNLTLAVGTEIKFVPAHSSTSATPTLQLNGINTSNIVGPTGAALASGDILTTAVADVRRGPNDVWWLQNPQTTSGGGTSVNVNGSSVSNPNFNGTTPAASTNGKNVTYQVTGSNVSSEIVGDGNAAHYLDGTGNYTTPAGGGGTTTNPLTAAATGGAAPGTTFNGSVAETFDYHSFSAQCALSLTTTGTSGASTLSACSGGTATLNIPQYSGAATPLISRVNVMDYGAVADGNVSANTGTDNTTAFTNCLTAAIAAKDVCYVPAGVYRIATSLPTISVNGTGFVGDVWGYSASSWGAPSTVIFSSSSSATILTISSGGSSFIAGDTLKNIALQRGVAGGSGSIALLLDHVGGAVIDRNHFEDSATGMDITYAPAYGVGIISNNSVDWGYAVSCATAPLIGYNLHGSSNGFLSTRMERNTASNNSCGGTSYGFKADGALLDLMMDHNETSQTSYGVYFAGSVGRDLHILNQIDDANTTNCEYFDYSGVGASTDLKGGWCDASHPSAGGTILHNVRGVKVSEREYYDSGAVFPNGITIETGSTANAIQNNTFYQPNGVGIVCNASNGNNFSGNTFNLVGAASEAMTLTNCSNSVVISNKAVNGTSTVIALDASSNNNLWTNMNSWESSGTAVSDAGTGNLLPTAVWGSITGTLSSQTDLQTALNAKAPIASPTFTGTVTVPALTLSGVTGSVQCLHASSSGVVSGTGADCGTGSAGALTQLAQTVVSGTATTAITFSAIPGTYSSLRLDIMGKTSDASTANVDIACTINGDTGSNYDRAYMQGGTNAPSAGIPTIGGTSSVCFTANAASALANMPSSTSIFFPNYANTTFSKTFISGPGIYQFDSNTGHYMTVTDVGTWRPATPAAITSITLTDTSGGHFLAGTVATLYGVQ